MGETDRGAIWVFFLRAGLKPSHSLKASPQGYSQLKRFLSSEMPPPNSQGTHILGLVPAEAQGPQFGTGLPPASELQRQVMRLWPRCDSSQPSVSFRPILRPSGSHRFPSQELS